MSYNGSKMRKRKKGHKKKEGRQNSGGSWVDDMSWTGRLEPMEIEQ